MSTPTTTRELKPPAAVNQPDIDPVETQDWVDSLIAVRDFHGAHRARFLLERLGEWAKGNDALPRGPLTTDYVNTVPASEEPAYPGDEELEQRLQAALRWNAAAMVVRANTAFPGVGGHMSTYASAAQIYEVCFHHFFRGPEAPGGGDQIYYQGHASPGIYARAFLEGRLGEEQLEHFRREVERGKGLSSYPHPRLMSEFWQFPTVSMGLAPINAIYQARFNRYLQARGVKDTSQQRVWAFLGDGETDEPESLGALSIAAREGLDNLTFVVNCNLQRLDGPVRGNGNIVQELESVFRGAGWNVVKVLWGRGWDEIFARDPEGAVRARMREIVDGQWQKYIGSSPSYFREHFTAGDERIAKALAPLSDEELDALTRGGHDVRKLYAGLRAAVETKGQPSVVLVQSVKGWLLGESFEGTNVTHQMKKLTGEELVKLRDRLALPLSDEQAQQAEYFHPGADSAEVRYLAERRAALGGSLPARSRGNASSLALPEPKTYEEFDAGSGENELSTTMAFVRLLAKLIRDKGIGSRVVPIVPDEARTFGMETLFRQVGIYSPSGQLYEPIDKEMLLYYKESKNGQVLQEGINEAGSIASFTAASTSYSVHGEPMVPFYAFYSMFGFQRVGDQIWALGDSLGRGFLLGATAGRTTLNGEGLQHEDGHSLLHASTVPNCQAYDPAFAYEIAAIVRDGMQRMYADDESVFYYLTLQNENYPMPAAPSDEVAGPEGLRAGILKGLYRFKRSELANAKHRVQLFGSASILMQVLEAQKLLAEKFGVAADVWSATSYTQLRREALECERWNRWHPESTPRVPYLTRALEGVSGPFLAASDYMKTLADQIARWIPGRFVPLGTDGFGMSDTREALRRHFEVDAASIAYAALDALRAEGKLDAKTVAAAAKTLGLDPEKLAPMAI
ncbi:MAG: pyruvate dehydrogenase (acetyl-transferring), homodimeric type [Planctomycetes bacterium]|nr:pyruvate dehydrogenase (acetyl-transferring), homodimeric type [Planctomycetota bacterium]